MRSELGGCSQKTNRNHETQPGHDEAAGRQAARFTCCVVSNTDARDLPAARAVLTVWVLKKCAAGAAASTWLSPSSCPYVGFSQTGAFCVAASRHGRTWPQSTRRCSSTRAANQLPNYIDLRGDRSTMPCSSNVFHLQSCNCIRIFLPLVCHPRE